MARRPDAQKRSVLLEAATDHVLEHGMAGLSLRPLALALGTSPRMLLYHFGSKEQLVTDVLAAARARQADLTTAWDAEQPDLGPAQLLLPFRPGQVDQPPPVLRLFFRVY